MSNGYHKKTTFFPTTSITVHVQDWSLRLTHHVLNPVEQDLALPAQFSFAVRSRPLRPGHGLTVFNLKLPFFSAPLRLFPALFRNLHFLRESGQLGFSSVSASTGVMVL